MVHEFLDLGIDLQNGAIMGLGFLLLVLSIIILVIFVARSNCFDFF
jgi:Na+-transporting methylmalonyl-CoA/oxaloacetate decarboxylase gamma subunit